MKPKIFLGFVLLFNLQDSKIYADISTHAKEVVRGNLFSWPIFKINQCRKDLGLPADSMLSLVKLDDLSKTILSTTTDDSPIATLTSNFSPLWSRAPAAEKQREVNVTEHNQLKYWKNLEREALILRLKSHPIISKNFFVGGREC